MSSRRTPADARAGLCALCLHAQRVVSDRGSVFWLCRRSAEDRRFPKYPTLPVLACPGFERDAGAGGESDPETTPDRRP